VRNRFASSICHRRYEAHNAAVRAGIAAHRLLEFDVAERWEKLCDLLDVTVPDTAFPNVNDREQFRGSPTHTAAVQRRGPSTHRLVVTRPRIRA